MVINLLISIILFFVEFLISFDFFLSSLPILKSLHHWGDTKKRTINKVIEKNYVEVANL